MNGEAKFTVGALAAESAGELSLLPGAGGEGEGTERLSGVEVGRKAKLLSSIAKKAALQCGLEGGQGGDVEGDAVGCGAASTADGATGEDGGCGCFLDFGGPPCFFVAGQLGHLRQMLAEAGVPDL